MLKELFTSQSGVHGSALSYTSLFTWFSFFCCCLASCRLLSRKLALSFLGICSVAAWKVLLPFFLLDNKWFSNIIWLSYTASFVCIWCFFSTWLCRTETLLCSVFHEYRVVIPGALLQRCLERLRGGKRTLMGVLGCKCCDGSIICLLKHTSITDQVWYLITE